MADVHPAAGQGFFNRAKPHGDCVLDECRGFGEGFSESEDLAERW